MKKISIIFIFNFLLLSCLGNTMSLENGKSIKIKLEDGQSTTINNVKITVHDFVEAFIRVEGRHSSYTSFQILTEKENQKLKFEGKYGAEIKAFEYSIKVDWCVTGTRDFKSHAVLVITKIS